MGPKILDDGSSERILAKALIHFAERGFEGASAREICAAAKTNVAMVSYYFGGKEGLYKACLKRVSARYHEIVRPLLKAPKSRVDFENRISVAVETFLEINFREPELFRVFDNELSMMTERFEDTSAKPFMDAYDVISLFFKAAQAGEIIKKEFDPKLLANFLYALLNHQLRVDGFKKRFTGRSCYDAKERERVADHVTRFICEALVL